MRWLVRPRSEEEAKSNASTHEVMSGQERTTRCDAYLHREWSVGRSRRKLGYREMREKNSERKALGRFAVG